MTNTEIIDLLIRVISELGFPIFVASWLLFKTDKILTELRDSINELRSTIITVSKRITKE